MKNLLVCFLIVVTVFSFRYNFLSLFFCFVSICHWWLLTCSFVYSCSLFKLCCISDSYPLCIHVFLLFYSFFLFSPLDFVLFLSCLFFVVISSVLIFCFILFCSVNIEFSWLLWLSLVHVLGTKILYCCKKYYLIMSE